jgi:hypothetical protein
MVGRGVWLDDIRSVVKEKLHNNLTPSPLHVSDVWKLSSWYNIYVVCIER